MAGNFEMAEQCFKKSQDFNSLLLYYSSYGDAEGLQLVADEAEKSGKYNVAYEAAFIVGDADRCVNILLKSKRVAEAAFFARAYAPSRLGSILKQWEESLRQKKLPFQPEDILQTQKQIMDESLEIESQLREKFYSQPKAVASDFESFKEEYYRDIFNE